MDKRKSPKILKNTGTVVFVDLKRKDFGNIHVDISAPELKRLVEVFFESLPKKQKERSKKLFNQLINIIFNRYNKFSVLINPVTNIKMLKDNRNFHL